MTKRARSINSTEDFLTIFIARLVTYIKNGLVVKDRDLPAYR